MTTVSFKEVPHVVWNVTQMTISKQREFIKKKKKCLSWIPESFLIHILRISVANVKTVGQY